MRPCFYLLFLAWIGISCSDKDLLPDEDAKADFSRLYVSFEEYNTSNAGVPDSNIRIISRADSTVFAFDQAHVSAAKGGGLIYFNPFLRALIQSTKETEAINDQTIYLLGIGTNGELNNSASMRSPLFSTIKGIAYHSSSESLILLNQDGNNSGIHIVYRPRNMSPQYRPYRKLYTSGLVMGATFFAADKLFVLKTNDSFGLYVFDGVLTRTVSTIDSSTTISPSFIIPIEGANQVHAIAYDSLHNQLAITDYTDGKTLGTGRILIFDAFSQQLQQRQLTPTRIITGPATGLTLPIAIALDTRASAQYFYVADRSKKILRFKLTDVGDVIPDQIIFTEQTPAGIALDARNSSTLPK